MLILVNLHIVFNKYFSSVYKKISPLFTDNFRVFVVILGFFGTSGGLVEMIFVSVPLSTSVRLDARLLFSRCSCKLRIIVAMLLSMPISPRLLYMESSMSLVRTCMIFLMVALWAVEAAVVSYLQ